MSKVLDYRDSNTCTIAWDTVLTSVQLPSVYEDGDLSFGLRGGSVNCFMCPALESARIAIKIQAIYLISRSLQKIKKFQKNIQNS